MESIERSDFSKIIAQAPIGICILDAGSLRAEAVNQKFIEVAGKPYEQIYGRFYWDSFAEAREFYESALANVVQTGQTYYANEVALRLIRHGKEETINVTFVYDPLINEAGKVSKVVVWVLENTNAVNERDSLQESNLFFELERDRLKRFLMQVPAGICILDGPDLVYELVNTLYQQMLPGRELMGRPILEALPELVGTPLEHILKNVYQTGEPYIINELLVPIARHEGGPTYDRYFNLTYQARRNEKGEIDGIIIFAYEVTDIISVQLALEKERAQTNHQKRLFEAISSGTPDLMYVFDLDYRFSYANPALLTMWGKTWENAIGKNLLENGYEPWHAEMHEREIDQIRKTGQPLRGEVSFPHAELGRRIYDYILTPVFNEKQEVEAVAGVTRDVTDRKIWEDSLAKASEELQAINEEMAATNEELTAANEELTATNEELALLNQQLQDARQQVGESEEALRLAVSAANLGTWHINPVTKELTADLRVKELYGFYPSDDFNLEQAIACVREDYRQEFTEKLSRAIQEKKEFDVTYPVLGMHDDKVRWLRSMGNISAYSSDTQTELNGVSMDITEQQLQNQRKNDFIGMVSHELKTPITSLNGYLQLMEEHHDEGDKAMTEHALNKSLQQVKKMTRMIDSFLNVARLESGKIFIDSSEFMLNDLMHDVEEELKAIFTTHQLEFKYGPAVQVNADREKIAQVLNNFVSNAVKYSGHGSTITVSTSATAGSVTIHVTDTGRGIADADLPHIFERFYRADSAQVVAGFGIGLYLCAEIVRLHHGSIGVESEKGHGAHFYFTLPVQAGL